MAGGYEGFHPSLVWGAPLALWLVADGSLAFELLGEVLGLFAEVFAEEVALYDHAVDVF